jgi:hypothetical protein
MPGGKKSWFTSAARGLQKGFRAEPLVSCDLTFHCSALT